MCLMSLEIVQDFFTESVAILQTTSVTKLNYIINLHKIRQ